MAEGGVVDVQALQELFKDGWEAQKTVEKDELSSTSEEFKGLVLKGIGCLEQATHLANQLSLFSSNEGLDDVSTADLKYLLLPALLGDMTLQASGDRLETIRKARIYFVDYLQRCKSYAVTTDDPPGERDHTLSAASVRPTPPSKPTYEQMASERTAKIARLREQKEIERKLKELTVRVELSLVSPRHQVDEEVVRDHALTFLHVWVYRCQDHVRYIDQEAELLESMQKRGGAKESNGCEATPPDPPKLMKPFKPIVITKEMLQSKVYGAGYPSLPLMSVEEFYEQKYKEEMEHKKLEGVDGFPVRVVDDSIVGGARGWKDLEAEENEGVEEVGKEEDDSEEAVRKARDRDEFKDDNRTGWGNKKNMG